MLEEIFDYMDAHSLDLNSAAGTVEEVSEENLIDLINGLSDLIPDKASIVDSPFQFVANSSMAGGKSPCRATACRLDKVAALSQFAALYAEKVLIPRPFDDLSGLEPDGIDGDVREDINARILIIHFLRPLLDQGLIGFVSNTHYCMDCYSQQLGDVAGEFRAKFEAIYDYLIDLYSKDVNYRLVEHDGFHLVEIEGPENLIEHRSAALFLDDDSKLVKAIGKFGNKTITAAESIEYGFASDLAGEIMNDLIIHNWHAVQDGSNYITSRAIDENVFGRVRGDSSNQLNQTINKALSHSLPILNGVSLDKLVRLRVNEGESFQVYRDALSNTLTNKHLSLAEFEQAFSDVVRPEINKINLSIKNSRKLLADSVRQDIVLGAGFVSLGLFGGFLPPNIGELVAALGGYQYASDLIGNVNSLTKEPEGISDEQFYFLWKANKVTGGELL
jgi:hypothetical protein